MSDRAYSIVSIEGQTTAEWQVASAQAHERLFAPTRVLVRALADAAPDLDAVIGKPASVELGIEGRVRIFYGVVTEASAAMGSEDRVAIEIAIESEIALLALGRDHRIFQNMTVEDVVRDVVARAGLACPIEWHLSASYEPHENIVQYGESDLDFVLRLLFEEGIGLSIEQREDGEHAVFFDDDSVFAPIEGDGALSLVRTGSEQRRGLRRWEDTISVTSDQVMQRDYDLESPGTDLTTSSSTEEACAREVYLHPAGYTDTGRGQRLCDRWLERLRMRARSTHGESDVESIAPGRTLSVQDCPRAALDGDYVAIEVLHSFSLRDAREGGHGAALEYENSFEAIPAGVAFRPDDAPRVPAMFGVQHAFATVPAGEEIHSDENGRTKVRFVWDRSGITDDKSSTWLRVGQLALGGSMVMPRGAFETLVDFELGDLDRPAVSGMGHLYNAESSVPYALPAGLTMSSFQTATTDSAGGANELRFEDAAGAEEILVHASQDLIAAIDDTTSWSVGNDQTLQVGNDEVLSVVSDHRASVAGHRTLEIDGAQDATVGGQYSDGVGADLAVQISGNRLVTAGGDHVENVGGDLVRTVGSLQSITGLAGVSRSITGSSKTTVSAVWAELAGSGRALNVAGSYTETIGALKLVKAAGVSIACDAAYAMTAAAEVVDVGGSRTDEASGALALTAGAKLEIKAKTIVLEAESKLVFRGGGAVIELGKMGTVKIKAPSVTIENADALKQIMHKSN